MFRHRMAGPGHARQSGDAVALAPRSSKLQRIKESRRLRQSYEGGCCAREHGARNRRDQVRGMRSLTKQRRKVCADGTYLRYMWRTSREVSKTGPDKGTSRHVLAGQSDIPAITSDSRHARAAAGR